MKTTQTSSRRRFLQNVTATAVAAPLAVSEILAGKHILSIPAPSRRAGDLLALTIRDVPYRFRWCPPGTFLMGSPEEEQASARSHSAFKVEDETQHTVTLNRGFWMGETPVTQAQWRSMMKSRPCLTVSDVEKCLSEYSLSDDNRFLCHGFFDGEQYGFFYETAEEGKAAMRHLISECRRVERAITEGTLPAKYVSWFDCQAFIAALNKHTSGGHSPAGLPKGFKFALPTEAQWEYACRAGTTGEYAGNLDDMAHYDGDWDWSPLVRRFFAVGGKKPNPWNLYDMHGYLLEWCADWYGDYPNGAVTDPTGSVTGTRRVKRGGELKYEAAECRSACRYGCAPEEQRYYAGGFRLCIVET